MNITTSWLFDKNGVATLAFLLGLWSYWTENRRKATARFNDLKPHFEIGKLKKTDTTWFVPLKNYGGLIVFVGAVKNREIIDIENRRLWNLHKKASREGDPAKIVLPNDKVIESPAVYSVLSKDSIVVLKLALPTEGNRYSLLFVWRDADNNAFLHRISVSSDEVTGDSPGFTKYVKQRMHMWLVSAISRKCWPQRKDCFVPNDAKTALESTQIATA